MTYEYLQENKLKAVPFDKGLGFCIMKECDYYARLDTITDLSQFKVLEITRKNQKNPVIKEENRIRDKLKYLLQNGKIDQELYQSLKPRGSKPAQIYGLAKVHKIDIPLRPIVSMPGTSYGKIGQWVSKWLAKIPEAKINTSTEKVKKELKFLKLDNDEVLISFDVTQLYTYVPVNESIEMAAKRLYEVTDEIPVDMNTFIDLAKLACTDILIKTHKGYVRQQDGLAMGIQCAPQLANIWMSAFDNSIKSDSKLYERYMDDILRIIKKNDINRTLQNINNLHKNLRFTKEQEAQDGTISFLDMKLRRKGDGTVESEWFRKKSDTGLTINFNALAPAKYKRSMVINLIHRIFNATSSWELFHKGLSEAKEMLEYNQYPKDWYEKIIHKTLEKILMKSKKDETDEEDKKMVFIEYRGKITDHFTQKLRETNAPIKPIMTLRKIKTALPSLKERVEKVISSNVVYQFKCPQCNVSYVGMTCRHLITRISEHSQNGENLGPIREHTQDCINRAPAVDDFKVLKKTHSIHSTL